MLIKRPLTEQKETVIVPVVVDTNVLVPSLYRKAWLHRFILRGNLLLIWNQFIFNEANRIAIDLWDRYSATTALRLDDVINAISLVYGLGSYVSEMPDDWPPVSADRADDPFFWGALQGSAEYIISHDKSHMLKLSSFQGIPIGTSKQFFDWVKVVHPMDTPEIEPDDI